MEPKVPPAAEPAPSQITPAGAPSSPIPAAAPEAVAVEPSNVTAETNEPPKPAVDEHAKAAAALAKLKTPKASVDQETKLAIIATIVIVVILAIIALVAFMQQK